MKSSLAKADYNYKKLLKTVRRFASINILQTLTGDSSKLILMLKVGIQYEQEIDLR